MLITEPALMNKPIPEKPESAYVQYKKYCKNTDPKPVICVLPDFKKIHVSLFSRATISASGTASEATTSFINFNELGGK